MNREEFRLYGRKWFTSAISAQMALTLARPEGNPPGGRGLALFYVETRDEHGPAAQHRSQSFERQARNAQGSNRGVDVGPEHRRNW